MEFGPVALKDAEGAILAHSLRAGGRKLKKGLRLGQAEIAALAEEGVAEVIAARLGPEDMHEDEAAAAIGRALAPDPQALGLSIAAPFTGRLNLYALTTGLLTVDAGVIRALNAIDESITLATLPDRARVRPRQMAATVKIIPYAAPRAAVQEACALLAADRPIRLRPPVIRSAALVLTETPGMKPALLEKGSEAVRARLSALGVRVAEERRIPHRRAAVAEALRDMPGAMALVLGASATSDRRDVAPGAVEDAGGVVERFGMPVDPGNLMFCGTLPGGGGGRARPVIGLPGCVRSPALNGVDWVLERIVCGLGVTPDEIAGMGVGGLLKEIPSRPQPRSGGAASPDRPVVSAVLLAAGMARRMGGRDKLLEDVGGEPVLRRVARALTGSGVDEVVAVVRPGDDARRAALEGLGIRIAENPEAAEGMASSIRAGLAGLRADADAAVLALGDMPEIGAAHVDALLAAFDPGEGRAIARATDAQGRPGHPVLFGRRFFESLSRLRGDEGARDILRANADFVVDVTTPGRGARLDLDTPEAWAAWRAEKAEAPGG